MSLLDQPKAVRAGEELDAEKLRAYLATHIEGVSESEPLLVKQFPGGHSNLTYLVSQGAWQAVLRRPPVGSKVKAAHDMGREHRVLSRLGPAFAKAPTPLAYCDDESILGCSFYVMERVEGFILRKEFPDEMSPTPELLADMCRSMIDTLAEVHEVDYEGIGLGELGRPEGYVQRQVDGWTRRYRDAKTDDIAAVESVASWLADNIPVSTRAALIHNDYKFDNLVLNPENPREIRGILDWEMTTLGDPLMDLGGALGYWVQADDPAVLHNLRFCPTHLPGMFSRQQIADYYAERTGTEISNMLFYYIFGLFKSLVIVQQIYYRFHKGLTTDPRFGQFIHAVGILSAQAQRAIDQGHV